MIPNFVAAAVWRCPGCGMRVTIKWVDGELAPWVRLGHSPPGPANWYSCVVRTGPSTAADFRVCSAACVDRCNFASNLGAQLAYCVAVLDAREERRQMELARAHAEFPPPEPLDVATLVSEPHQWNE